MNFLHNPRKLLPGFDFRREYSWLRRRTVHCDRAEAIHKSTRFPRSWLVFNLSRPLRHPYTNKILPFSCLLEIKGHIILLLNYQGVPGCMSSVLESSLEWDNVWAGREQARHLHCPCCSTNRKCVLQYAQELLKTCKGHLLVNCRKTDKSSIYVEVRFGETEAKLAPQKEIKTATFSFF